MFLTNPEDRKIINCPVCNNSKFKKIFERDNNTTIVKCKECSLHYMNPIYSDKELDKFYVESDYFNVYGENIDGLLKYNLNATSNKDSHYFYRLNLIRKFLSKGSKVLEIGSSFGDFTNFLQKNDYDAYGLEINHQARKISNDRFPSLFVYDKYLDKIDENAKFDLIVFYAVLEHITDPIAFIQSVKNRLNEGGFVYISVPNINTYYFLRNKWADISTSLEHVVFYNGETLTNLMNKFGFEKKIIATKKFDLKNQPIHYRIVHYLLQFIGAGKELEAIYQLK